MKKLRFFCGLLMVFLFSSNTNGESEGLLNKLLAPGPLYLGHKDLEVKDCLKCHDAGKGISDSKCLECHNEIKKFVDSKKGYHGINNQACRKCHEEHKGREYETTLVDSKKFDHGKMTGYSLEGKHAEIKCIECHKEKRSKKATRKNEVRYLGQVTTCVSCHKKEDIHLFTGKWAAKDCNACHSNQSWKQNVKFDHNTDTKFKLIGHHLKLKCLDCHQPNKNVKSMKYSWSDLEKKQCLSCHQDFHKNKISSKFSGGKCLLCHSQNEWKIAKFDHEITKFKLKGKHSELLCGDCHKEGKSKQTSNQNEVKNINFTGLKTQCLSCHQDFHKFNLFKSAKMGELNQCLKCHTETSWKQVHHFDHNLLTRFPIDGLHIGIKCSTCHLPNPQNLKTPIKNIFSVKTPTYHWKELAAKTCETCHKSPHRGVFNSKLLAQKCTTCHTTEGWTINKAGSGFDHGKTRFPLTAAHKTTKCSDCHESSTGQQIYKFKSVQLQFCTDCHSNFHGSQFSSKFSTLACTSCHTTQNFKERIDFDHSKTNYPLIGEHQKLKCSECHKPINESISLKWPNFKSKDRSQVISFQKSRFLFPEIKQQKCLTCHADYHMDQLSSSCQECHTEKSWKPANFIHNKQSRFLLKDKHEKVDCLKCHLPTKKTVQYKGQSRAVIRYKPISSSCIDCHKDPHKGNFGRNCHECHTEKSWSSSKDFHKNFTLSGVHYYLDCGECHKDGRKLAGFSQQCISCHQKDDIHNGMLKNCKDCHTQHFWEASQFKHSLTRFPLRGAHRTIDCADCHVNGVYKGLSTSCVSCHLQVYLSNPGPHGAGNTNCMDCHRNTFTFKSK